MTRSIFGIGWRVLIAVVVGVIAMYLFRSVLSARGAEAVGIIVAVAELGGSLLTSKSGAGHGFRFLVRLGEVVLSWPVAAYVLQYVGVGDRDMRIGFAAAVSAAIGMLAQRHGSGRETRRLVTVACACAIPAYAMIHSILSGDAYAVIASCVAVAIALCTVRVAVPGLPPKHRDALVACAGAVLCAGVLAVARTLI